MMIAARNAFLMSGGKPTARDYVQSGLTAMWDGIENAGWGQRNSTASSWLDLIGGRVFSGSCGWSDTAATFNGSQILSGTASEEIADSDAMTIEAVCWATNITGVTASTCCYVYAPKSYPGGKNYREVWFGKHLAVFGSKFVSGKAITATTTPRSYSFDYSNSLGYRDGVSASLVASPDYWHVSRPSIGGSYDYNASTARLMMIGAIHSIRVYSRALSAAEVAANYAIDAARFGL